MKNGEGYQDPTASQAINRAFKSAKQQQMTLGSMRRKAQRECLSYETGCMKVVNGEKKICPLKMDKRGCLAITSTDEEIKAAYLQMFPEERHEKMQ